MKKVIGVAVAVVFVLTAAVVMAQTQPAAPAKADVKATETTKAPATMKVEEKKVEMKGAETAKFDFNKCVTDCKADAACKAKCDTEQKANLAKTAAPAKADAKAAAPVEAPKTK